MRLITINKDSVSADFPGFNYPVYSRVIVNENGKEAIGKIIGYSGLDTVLVESNSGKQHTLNYSDIVFYEEPTKPTITLAEVESLARKYIDHYSKKSNAVTVNGKDYYIDIPVSVIFDNAQINDQPGALMAACSRDDSSGYDFIMLVPYIQYADQNQIEKLILHEVAHLITGPHRQHDSLWLNICKTIGGDTRKSMPLPDIALNQIKYQELPTD